MKPKSTWPLVLLAAGLFAFIFLFERHAPKPAPVVARVLPGLKALEVTSMEITPKGQALIRVERTNETWQLTRPMAYAVKAPAVEALLQAIEELTAQAVIPPEELKGRHKTSEEFGFDDPQTTLVLTAGDEPRTLKLGKLTAPGDQVYVQVVGGTAGIFVVGAEILKLVPRSVNDWRDTAFTSLKGATLERIKVANGAKPAIELQREGTNALWRMTKPGTNRADNVKIQTLLSQVQGLRASKFVTDDAKADLESFGLQPPELELTLGGSTNDTVIQFGKSPTNDTGLVYARANKGTSIVLVPRETVSGWRVDPEEFRDRLLLNFTVALPDRIEVSGPESNENFTVFNQTSNTWVIEEASGKVLPADIQLLQRFINILANIEAVVQPGGQIAFKDAVLETDLPTYGLVTNVLRYVFKKNNSILAQLDLGATNKEGLVYARRGDEQSVYAVSNYLVQILPKNGLVLASRGIWNFNIADVAKLAIRTNGNFAEFERRGANEWQTTAGKIHPDKPGEMLMEVAVDNLCDLKAEGWIGRGSQNREQYGITEKSLSLTLEMKGSTNTKWTVEFGNKTPDGRFRFAATQVAGEYRIFAYSEKDFEFLVSTLKINENFN